ncbi:Hypothetical_protein [Hexamita inflata]|uniref:Hypothetical_protein n=1 Tax=Hexamita inflata TaxID=28002 RepID=A0AA86QN81_9EUKA|nr:Hypothetical protein HINF_LOCUS44707 [Hexamita inflata]
MVSGLLEEMFIQPVIVMLSRIPAAEFMNEISIEEHYAGTDKFTFRMKTAFLSEEVLKPSMALQLQLPLKLENKRRPVTVTTVERGDYAIKSYQAVRGQSG